MKLEHAMSRRTATLILLVVALVALTLSRSWMRSSVLSWYGNQTVGKQVNTAFNSSFGVVNRQFQSSGIKPAQAPLSGPTCFTANYHYFRVSVWCLRIQSDENLNNTPTPAAFISNWPKILQSLSLSNSPGAWHLGKSNTNIADPGALFNFKDAKRNEVGFTRQVGSVECALTIDADPAQGGYTSGYRVSEECDKDLNFFGGWNCSKNFCEA